MKKLKVNLMMVLALVIGVATMSFKLADTDTAWHYDGSGSYTDANNWILGSAPSNTCQVGGTKPCEIEVDAPTKPDLEELLSNMDDQQVLDLNSVSRRF
ncbi:hypothetical protein [Sphingobacterium hotanense]|uniref:hypothetical protein n=1 Tax=Sphingobacterium hotanense TaxID=649196 RepID=UPI0021A4F2C5|nr:hypothetical protein [Sphingobacterium hotanense]MCT1524126.1 hypothetical protein [Sphingobacterium hotanense]